MAILFFKGYEGNFYASDLGNMGFGNPFLLSHQDMQQLL